MDFARVLCVVIALGCLLTAQAATKLELLGQTSLLKSNDSKSAPGTEQVAYDDKEKVAYLIGDTKLYVIDLSPEALLDGGAPASTPRELPILHTVTLPTIATDVAFCSDYVAVSAEGSSKVLPGFVTIFSRYLRQQHSPSKGSSAGTGSGAGRSPGGSLQQLTQLTVGALPDQLEFSWDCRTLLVSNEGEPETYTPPSLANDPEGSVSVIKLHYCDTDNNLKSSKAKASSGSGSPSSQSYDCSQARVFGNVRTTTFSAWNDRRQELLSQGVKLSGVGASVSQDLEPEYTTFSKDEKLAFVALQENNAIAVLDVESATIRSIHALGFKDHSKPWNPLDPSDTPLAADISPWPVFGMYQPDDIKSFRYQGVDYLITANEGDSRADWPGLKEETIVSNISSLDPSVFQDINSLASNASLGRWTVLAVDEKPYQPYNGPNSSGKFTKLFSFGARSFAIWRLDQVSDDKSGSTTLTLVFDSGAQLEQVRRDKLYDIYNSEGLNNTFDKRSAYKGPEPEGVAVGPCANPADSRPEAPKGSELQGTNSSPTDRLCLFLGTERLGVIFVYDITDPTRPSLQSWARPPQPNSGNHTTRLVALEGLAYARYQLSATSAFPILLAAYEGSDEGAPAGLGVYKVVDA